MRLGNRATRQIRGRPIAKKALIAFGAISLTLPLVSHTAGASGQQGYPGFTY